MTDPEFKLCYACEMKDDSSADICFPCLNNREAIFYLLEVLRAAEKIEGVGTNLAVTVHRADVAELHRAIRKAKGMDAVSKD